MNTPLSSISYIDRQWNDVIFANRHKAYGAYYIRTRYNRNIGVALGISALFFLGLFASVGIYLNVSGIKVIASDPSPLDVITITETKKVVDQPAKPKVKRPVPSNVAPVVRVDSAVPPPMDTTSVIPVKTPEGTDSSLNPPTGSEGGTAGGKSTEPQGGLMPTTVDTALGFAQVMPEFPGGEAALEKYIQRNTTIPNEWRNEGPEEGKVYFSFVVGQDGEIRDVKIISDGAGYGCGESNTGMFLHMPAWKPGMQNGHKVSVLMRLPIIFRRQ